MRLLAFNARGFVRLISATHHKPPVLRGLVDSDDEMAILAEIEGETSARLLAERDGTPALDRRELAFRRRAQDLKLYGETHINAAFAYTRPTGNRFNGGERGAWYCSEDDLTSIEEVGYHRTRELGFIGRFEDSALYVALLADFTGTFPDIFDEPESMALHADPDIGYPAGQALALSLRQAGHRGLTYPSVRRAGGRCFVAFDPGLVHNVRPGATWRLTWAGASEFTAEAL